MKTEKEYYSVPAKGGRPVAFANEKEFAEKANEYFDFVLQNPLKEEKLFLINSGDGFSKVKRENLHKMRAMSIGGFCSYAGITRTTFYDYEKKEGFSHIVKLTKQVIENQTFEGASAGLLRENIIARTLGLHEKSETTTNQVIKIEGITTKEINDILKE